MKQRNVFRMSIFGKLLLIGALLLGGGNSVWADTVIFGGSVASGWTYTNSAGTTKSVTNSALYDGGSYNSPSYYTSTSSIAISSGQTIQINAKKASSSLTPSIKIKLSSDGSSYSTTKEFDGDNITSTSDTDELIIDDITGTYYLQFELKAVYVYSIVIKDFNPYPVPTNLMLDNYTSTTATFSWTAGNNEISWKFAYSTDSEFTPNTETAISIDSNPYTLNNLAEGTTYYATICAYYGDGHYSEWTEKLAFTPRNETDLTINDGSSTTNYAPIYGGNASKLTYTQVIIPSSDLTSIKNRQITKLTYYSNNSSVSWGNATFEVYMKITSSNAFTSNTPSLEDWGTNVFNAAKLSVVDGKMVVTLDTPFNYISGNLMIGFKQITTGTNSSVTWNTSGYISGIGMYSYGTTSGKVSYSPKVTITTTESSTAPVKVDDNGFTTFASAYPLDLANLPSGLKAYKAAVNGDKVNFTEINQTVPANTGMLLEGTAGETYFIPVAESGTAPEGNEFFVNSTGGTFSAESGYTYFGLLKNSNPLTFGVFDPASVAIPTNKAYLKVADVEGARVLSCSFSDGDIQGIEDNVTEHDNQLSGSTIFNLAGQKVENPTKGLYIINGRKQVIK